MGRNPNTLVHILGILHSRSGVAIRHVLRKLQSSSDVQLKGARIYIATCILCLLYDSGEDYTKTVQKLDAAPSLCSSGDDED
jgi:hypothetical protein